MKIISLEVDNFKRIRAVFMKLEVNGLTVIGGKNGQGKTSVLDSITVRPLTSSFMNTARIHEAGS